MLAAVIQRRKCGLCGALEEWPENVSGPVICTKCWDKRVDRADQEHKAEVAARRRKYYQEHKAEVAAWQRKYHQEHKVLLV